MGPIESLGKLVDDFYLKNGEAPVVLIISRDLYAKYIASIGANKINFVRISFNGIPVYDRERSVLE